jgi:tetratricopeptide (TPR) repeat protein
LRRAWDLLDVDTWFRWRWHIPLLRARAELALATDQLDEAWRYASQSLDLATQTDSRKHVAHAKLVLGEIAAAQDRFPEADKLLRSAVALADHLHAARELWLAASALGRLLERGGQDRDAETYLTQAAQTIEAIATGLTDPTLRATFVHAEPVADVYRRLGRRPLPIAG